MTWRLAKSLETLRSQVNRASPNRSKASDGTIGDAAHASRSSDHNPHIRDGSMGVVTAIDITHDPAHGVDIQALADKLIASRDPRIKYIICNGRIVSGSGQSKPAWKWRSYGGSNKHTKHVHISVKGSKAQYDSTAPWNFDLRVSPGQVTKPPAVEPPLLKRGSRGVNVRRLQRLLGVQADGVFGAGTEASLKAFQAAYGLVADGKVGPYTREALEKQPSRPAGHVHEPADYELGLRPKPAQRVPTPPRPTTPEKPKPAPTAKSGGKTGIFTLIAAAALGAGAAIANWWCSIPIIERMCQ